MSKILLEWNLPGPDIYWGLGIAAITWSGPIYKCTNCKGPMLKIFLIVLWMYEPDIPLYLNANCSKWWQPQVKTERGPEIPSTTQPAPLRTTEPALVIPDSCPSVSVFEILAIGTCFHIKLRSERSFNDDTHHSLSGGPHHLLTNQCFCQFLPILLPLEERLRAPRHRHLSETWDTVITPSNIMILLARVRSV